MAYAALVVDDEEAIRMLAARILRKAGFTRVDEARDGVEALQLLRTTRYCLAIIDLRMPRLSGYELLEELESAAFASRPYIIVATADHSVNGTSYRFNPSVVTAIMSKPFDIETLMSIARGCIEAQPSLSPSDDDCARQDRSGLPPN